MCPVESSARNVFKCSREIQDQQFPVETPDGSDTKLWQSRNNDGNGGAAMGGRPLAADGWAPTSCRRRCTVAIADDGQWQAAVREETRVGSVRSRLRGGSRAMVIVARDDGVLAKGGRELG